MHLAAAARTCTVSYSSMRTNAQKKNNLEMHLAAAARHELVLDGPQIARHDCKQI
jgi:hypothetical protein